MEDSQTIIGSNRPIFDRDLPYEICQDFYVSQSMANKKRTYSMAPSMHSLVIGNCSQSLGYASIAIGDDLKAVNDYEVVVDNLDHVLQQLKRDPTFKSVLPQLLLMRKIHRAADNQTGVDVLNKLIDLIEDQIADYQENLVAGYQGHMNS